MLSAYSAKNSRSETPPVMTHVALCPRTRNTAAMMTNSSTKPGCAKRSLNVASVARRSRNGSIAVNAPGAPSASRRSESFKYTVIRSYFGRAESEETPLLR